jgi:hypothetical protein
MADEEKKAADEKKSSSVLTKVVAGVCAMILAPLTVLVAGKWLDPSLWRSVPTASSPTPASSGSTPDRVPAPPAPRKDVVNLLTPKLSENFYSYGKGKNEEFVRDDNVDPLLFTCGDDRVLRVPGEYGGGLVTKKEYDNYVLTLEYKWGDKTYKPRKNHPRWAGVEVHGTGQHGHLALNKMILAKTWLQGYDIQIYEGQVGSIALRGLPDAVKAMARIKKHDLDLESRMDFDPQSPLSPIASAPDQPAAAYTVHALGTPERLGHVTGWHPPGDPARADDWNTVEITCADDTLRVKVNGKEVNKLTGLSQKSGKIMIVSEFAEVAFRRFELERLEK